MQTQATFEMLKQGDTFDWIAPGQFNSYFSRCIKTGPRTYETLDGTEKMRVGSIKAYVYHIGKVMA